MSEHTENIVEAVRHIIATLYSAQNALCSLAPEFNWAGMGNLLGDYGEFLAIHHYGFEKSPAGTRGSDCITLEGHSVQVKTNHAASSIGFRGEADKMLVLKVHDDGGWDELYYGDFNAVKKQANYSSRDNKFMITLSKLRRIVEARERARGTPE